MGFAPIYGDSWDQIKERLMGLDLLPNSKVGHTSSGIQTEQRRLHSIPIRIRCWKPKSTEDLDLPKQIKRRDLISKGSVIATVTSGEKRDQSQKTSPPADSPPPTKKTALRIRVSRRRRRLPKKGSDSDVGSSEIE